jgi:hypothetical protein
MMGAYRTGIQQFLILIWYFLTEKPAVEAVMEEKDTEERRSRIPAAQALRIKRRWERSKERMSREGRKVVL